MILFVLSRVVSVNLIDMNMCKVYGIYCVKCVTFVSKTFTHITVATKGMCGRKFLQPSTSACSCKVVHKKF